MELFKLLITQNALIGIDHIAFGFSLYRVQELSVKRGDFVLIIVEIVCSIEILTEEIRLVRLVGHSLLCFGEIDIAAYLFNGDILVQILAVKERISQLIERKTAACSLDRLFALAVAVNNTPYSFSS